jgi:hypothetical protein
MPLVHNKKWHWTQKLTPVVYSIFCCFLKGCDTYVKLLKARYRNLISISNPVCFRQQAKHIKINSGSDLIKHALNFSSSLEDVMRRLRMQIYLYSIPLFQFLFLMHELLAWGNEKGVECWLKRSIRKDFRNLFLF